MKKLTKKNLREIVEQELSEVAPWKDGGFTYVELHEYINGAIHSIEEAADWIDKLMDVSMEYGDPEFEFLEGRDMIMQLEAMKSELLDYARGAEETAQVDIDQM